VSSGIYRLTDRLTSISIRYVITIRVRELAEKAGIEKPYHLQQATGLSSEVSQRLWRDEFEKISKDTMERLCEALHCEPGDLFVRVKRKQKPGQ